MRLSFSQVTSRYSCHSKDTPCYRAVCVKRSKPQRKAWFASDQLCAQTFGNCTEAPCHSPISFCYNIPTNAILPRARTQIFLSEYGDERMHEEQTSDGEKSPNNLTPMLSSRTEQKPCSNPDLWSGRNRASVGGRRSFSTGSNSLSSTANLVKP